jgi:hypothetical protein
VIVEKPDDCGPMPDRGRCFVGFPKEIGPSADPSRGRNLSLREAHDCSMSEKVLAKGLRVLCIRLRPKPSKFQRNAE